MLDRIAAIPSIFAFLLLAGCASRPQPDAEMLTMDPHLEGFKKAAQFPSADVRTLTVLAQQFMAAGRDAEALTYFEALAERDPERAELRALVGLFHARTASEVALLNRIGSVEAGLAELDGAVEKGDPFSRLMRGLVSAVLPGRFERAAGAIEDLEWVLEHIDSFPDVRRAVHVAMARAHTRLEHPEKARLSWQKAGYATPPGEDEPGFSFSSTWTAERGLRFSSPPSLKEVAPGVWLAQGFEFTDIAFVETAKGLVAMDAGTSPQTARAALDAVRAQKSLPLTHVFVTHAHWDHIGGLPALVGPSTRVIANARFREELDVMAGGDETMGEVFWPYGKDANMSMNPDVLVGERQTMSFGGREFEFIPVDGGETVDALLILDKQTRTLFVGDVFMPYLGAPFVNEGDPEGLLRTMATIRELAPARLVHGHTPLTMFFNLDALPGFEVAIRELRDRTLEALRRGVTANEVIRLNIVPDALARHPQSVLPYMVMRDHFIQRMFHNRNGYWASQESATWETFTPEDWGAVLNLVSGESSSRLEVAAETLLERGDIAMAFQVSRLARQHFPKSTGLADVEEEALARLRFKYQATDPFRFLLYSATGSQELGALPD